MDFSVPADDQTEAPGYVPGRPIVLVRNPGWDPATDDLRPAYPDRIETAIGGDNDDLYNKVKANDFDFVVDGAVPPEIIREYQTDPDLQSKLHIYSSDATRYISFNLLMPPFDDIHVRKALNWAMDKDGMRQLRGGPSVGEIAGSHHGQQPREQPPGRLRPVRDAGLVRVTSRRPRKRWRSRSTTRNQDGVCDAAGLPGHPGGDGP